MRIATMTWVEAEEYLRQKKDLILPVGSTEQHGPTGLLGTDFLNAQSIAEAIGARHGLAVAPPLCYGVAAHHMAFAGTASVRPATYQALVAEVIGSFYQHGFRHFFVVNGHGGNEPSLRATFQTLKADGFEGASFQLYNWWKVPAVSKLAHELYGDREGFHATPSEVALTFHTHGLAARPYQYVARERASSPWPLTGEEMRAVFPDGTMRSDPGLAKPEDGAKFFDAAVDDIGASILGAARF